MKIVIDNRHMDYSGGGEHVRMIVSLLSHFADIYVTQTPQFYCGNDFTATNIHVPPKQYQGTFIPDLFIYVDYRHYVKPIGRVNAQICFYGLKKKVKGYNYALCINDFVAQSILQNWPHVTPFIIPPFFDDSLYKMGNKEKRLINIGNFFIEPDGHSKNQHLLIDWFLSSGLPESGWIFECYGFKNNLSYFSTLEEKIRLSPSVRLKPNAPREDVLDALSKSQFLIHGMGYNRKKPEQTEHFGLVAVEALLSGCRPIVHQSGGCPDIKGCLSYHHFDEITSMIQSEQSNPMALRHHGLHFNYKQSLAYAEAFIHLVNEKLSLKKVSFGHYFSLFQYLFKKK